MLGSLAALDGGEGGEKAIAKVSQKALLRFNGAINSSEIKANDL